MSNMNFYVRAKSRKEVKLKSNSTNFSVILLSLCIVNCLFGNPKKKILLTRFDFFDNILAISWTIRKNLFFFLIIYFPTKYYEHVLWQVQQKYIGLEPGGKIWLLGQADDLKIVGIHK